MANVGTHNTFMMIGATNHSKSERQTDDYYATDPHAMELLLDEEEFSHHVWECACGKGHLSNVLEQRGYDVCSTDLVDRGYGESGIDFLKSDDEFDGDIITNPPFKYAQEFVEHALEVVAPGHKVAMLLRLQFLEGVRRRELFDAHPPRTIYIPSHRITCVKNATEEQNFNDNRGAQAYAWFVWDKEFSGSPTVKWIN